jgi:hypothetical protein
MSLQRWLYTGGRPNRVARLADRFTAALSARGVGPDYLITLEVPRRRSGRTVSLPIVVANVRGERYLVSMLGEGVNWVRNVRAAGGDATLRRGRREEVRSPCSGSRRGPRREFTMHCGRRSSCRRCQPVPSIATPAPASRAEVLGGVTAGAAVLSCGVQVILD